MEINLIEYAFYLQSWHMKSWHYWKVVHELHDVQEYMAFFLPTNMM